MGNLELTERISLEFFWGGLWVGFWDWVGFGFACIFVLVPVPYFHGVSVFIGCHGSVTVFGWLVGSISNSWILFVLDIYIY